MFTLCSLEYHWVDNISEDVLQWDPSLPNFCSYACSAVNASQSGFDYLHIWLELPPTARVGVNLTEMSRKLALDQLKWLQLRFGVNWELIWHHPDPNKHHQPHLKMETEGKGTTPENCIRHVLLACHESWDRWDRWGTFWGGEKWEHETDLEENIQGLHFKALPRLCAIWWKYCVLCTYCNFFTPPHHRTWEGPYSAALYLNEDIVTDLKNQSICKI